MKREEPSEVFFVTSSVRGGAATNLLADDSGENLPTGVESAKAPEVSAPLGPAVRPRSTFRTALGIAIIAAFAVALAFLAFAR